MDTSSSRDRRIDLGKLSVGVSGASTRHNSSTVPPGWSPRSHELDIANIGIWVVNKNSGNEFSTQSSELSRPSRRIALHLEDAILNADHGRVCSGGLPRERRPLGNQARLIKFSAPPHVLGNDIEKVAERARVPSFGKGSSDAFTVLGGETAASHRTPFPYRLRTQVCVGRKAWTTWRHHY